MRIKSIEIEGLYDNFDYDIPLNQEDRITIIHAPNGFGKTIILKMLYGLLNQSFDIFTKVPFNTFKVFLDTTTWIEVNQLENSEKIGKEYNYEISFFENNECKEEKIDFNFEKIANKIAPNIIDKAIPHVKRVSPREWIDLETMESLNTGDVLKRYFSYLPESLYKIPNIKIPEWYQTLIERLKIHFIETQRLLVINKDIIKHRYYESSDLPTKRTVTIYAEELSHRIEETLNKYASSSQNLERTFPKRLIEHISISKDAQEIKNKLNKLDEKRQKLKEIGLWSQDEIQDIDFQTEQEIDENSLNVLDLYIQDAEQKLAVFDDLAKRIILFKDILNSRFQYKRIEIERKKGFSFFTHKDQLLDANDLSSGEQHELVLLYEMLFKVQENNLVLIDEPEISLHLIWQEKFLEDLSKIIKINKFDVMIATHSPEIINDRGDLTVALSKRKNDKKEESAIKEF